MSSTQRLIDQEVASDATAGTQRLLPRDPWAAEGLAAHLERHGALRQHASSDQWRKATLREIERAGLVGHGGAAFPTGQKLRALLAHGGKPFVIANGTEGEPASMKDRVLLARAPHLVLDGAALAASLVGAEEIVMVVHRDVREIVDTALAERQRTRLDSAKCRVVTAADGFVAGEASAVVNWVGRSVPIPMGKAPRMTERGLRGRPTLVQNVETLAHLGLIGRHGAEWFREVGTADEPGTMLVTLAGSVVRPGVFEVAIGARTSDVLELAGGPSEPIQALLIGGYFGTWIPAAAELFAPFSTGGLGVGLGAGLVVALRAAGCGVLETARLVRYLASQSAGQCGPCKFGLPAIAEQMDLLAEGRPVRFDDLTRWVDEIVGRGACGHPDGVARHIRSAFDVFAHEVSEHVAGRCSASEGQASLALFTEELL
jgi:NADH:ubiquinone oxidoreductase subunit F (NADH-binding)